MRALARFLRSDARAVALVGGLAAAWTAVPSATAEVEGRPHRAGERAFVRMAIDANRAEVVASALRREGISCLRDQARMLGRVAAPGRGRDLDALQERSNEFRDAYAASAAVRVGHEILERGETDPAARDRVASAMALRDACEDWTQRSLAYLTGRLADMSANGPNAVAQGRAAAARDAEMVGALLEGGIPEDADSVEAMETYGHRP